MATPAAMLLTFSRPAPTSATGGNSAVSAGYANTCALTTAGGVKCWGANDFGELGDGQACGTLCTTPVDVSGLTSSVAAVSAGGPFSFNRYITVSHTCALTIAGGVKCWGSNFAAELGAATTETCAFGVPCSTTSVDVTGLTSGVAAVSAGGLHTCALTISGGVKCWGANDFGELGDGQACRTLCTTPVDVSGLTSGVAAVSASGRHTCALTTAGGVKCWGANGIGQLGDGQACGALCTTPVDVSGLTSGIAAVSVGGDHACALTTGGSVKCWGGNFTAELGDGTTIQRTTPVDVSGLAGRVAAISAGGGRLSSTEPPHSHTCALTISGGVKCWGANDFGELGDGQACRTLCTTPVDVSGLTSGVAAVSAGGRHTCALTVVGGGVKCWGYNGDGQLGNGIPTSRSIPVNVSGLTSGVAAISAGGDHTCALTTAGGVKCWGANGNGQLGNGTSGTISTTPVDVSGLTGGVAAVSAGTLHTCALTTTGGIKCWGYNSEGELGDGTTTSRSSPADVSGLISGVAAVSAGPFHTCALTTAGGVKCWGENWGGMLGAATTEMCAFGVPCSTTSLDVTGLTGGVAAISAGRYHTCALTTAGGLKCWGGNGNGQLGDGQACGTDCTTPVDVSGLTTGVAAVNLGEFYTCALTTAGGVKCWGFGDLGDGTTIQRTTPVDVSGLTSGVAAISAGRYHTCALTTAGGLKCWGLNGNGQLGDGQACGTNCTTPVDVSGLTSGVAAVSAGGLHTCALTTPGGVKCWGDNGNGQLGDGTASFFATPVDVLGLRPKPTPTVTSTASPSATATPTPTATPTLTATPTPQGVRGDVNCSGTLNSVDALLILQFSAGLIGSLLCQQNADVNHSGSISAVDAQLILQVDAGLIPSLPAGEVSGRGRLR